MRRWTAALAAVLAGGVLMIGVATPAHAAGPGTLILGCTVNYNHVIYKLALEAEYNDSATTGLRTWNRFRFRVQGGTLEEDHNNVNIRLSEYGDNIFSYNSPDNLEYNRWYATSPASPVRTTAGRDHRTNALLEVEAIFDRAFRPWPLPGEGYDPSCDSSERTQ